MDMQLSPSAIVDEIGLTRDSIKNVFGVSDEVALARATSIVEDFIGKDLTSLKSLVPSVEEAVALTPTAIGKRLGGLNSHDVNKILEKAQFQYQDGKHWRLTESGAGYGEKVGYGIRWNGEILKVLSANKVAYGVEDINGGEFTSFYK